MNLIYTFCTLSLLWLNIAGISLALRRWLPDLAIARAAGLLLLGTGGFFLEHSIGLGKLTWVWPLSSLVAIYLLKRTLRQGNSRSFWRAECVFILAFAYGFAWKWAFPVIYPTSERITDLYFIGNYLPGETLPPLDHWFPPNRFNFYYAFQHYAAALLGRILGLSPGATYNISFALLMALSMSLAWCFIANVLHAPWKRWLVIITFVAGGTGATPFAHLGYTIDPNSDDVQRANMASDGMWASQRFIGTFDQRLNNDFGHRWFPSQATATWEPRDLPLEDFGYQFFVGDFHPPLGGFLLLMLALASISKLSSLTRSEAMLSADSTSLTEQHRFMLTALLAFTVPLMIATNTWVFPLQVGLLVTWIVWRIIQQQTIHWVALCTGATVGFTLLYPFLTEFASQAIPTPIKWVQSQDHTPFRNFLALHWPLILFGLLSGFAKGSRRAALLFSVAFLGLLLVSECLYVDDPTGGKYERTNTVMKWWGWIWSGGLVALASCLLASRVRWVQGGVILALLLINWYVLDVARYWYYTGKGFAGQLTADSVYTQDPVVKDMFAFLRHAPDGIVLENNYGGSFTDSGVYAAFAAKPSLLGWPMHLLTWHSSIGQVWVLKDQIVQFYTGGLPNALPWLLANNVKYIVWNARDAEASKNWAAIKTSIAEQYDWQEFQTDPNRHVGLWVRRYNH